MWSFALFAASTIANAQFKVVGPPPLPPAAARQKVRTLVEKVDASNRQQTVDTLTGLLAWYRDIIDDELISAWKKDASANLTEMIDSLADSRVASEIVQFSWREQRQASFNLMTAPMFGRLMVRFPESAQPFLDDLLVPIAQSTPVLSESEAEAVCRILLDMPDIGAWRQTALKILPRYRRAAETLLGQDAQGSNQEQRYQALRWLDELRSEAPGNTNEQPNQRRRPMRPQSPVSERAPAGNQTASALSPPAEIDSGPPPATSPAARPPVQPALVPSATPARITSAPPLAQAASPPAFSGQLYDGAKSGTLESTGSAIPQNAEYVFRNLPPVKLQLDYDAKTWDARLVPGEGQTQRLILKNKSSGPQKRCLVHWSVIP